MSILRRAMIEERKRLLGKEKRSAEICRRFLSEFECPKRVFCYVNFGAEVETKPLIETLLANGTRVFAPKTIRNDMKFYEVTDLSALVPGAYGISEPSGDTEEVVPEQTDLMIMPGLIFDEDGGRVGYGMGYYDRYLAAHPAYTVAFAFEMQVQTEPMKRKDTDIPYHMLITEKRVVKRENA